MTYPARPIASLRTPPAIKPDDLRRLLWAQLRNPEHEEAARRQLAANTEANRLRRKGWD